VGVDRCGDCFVDCFDGGEHVVGVFEA